jgi:hypothetical protein
MHGAKIWVKFQSAKATFALTLPVAVEQQVPKQDTAGIECYTPFGHPEYRELAYAGLLDGSGPGVYPAANL